MVSSLELLRSSIGVEDDEGICVEDEDPSADSGTLSEELEDPSAGSGVLVEELENPSAGSGVLIEEDDESISTHEPLVQTRGFSLSAGLISKPSLPTSHGISVPCCGGKLEPPFSLLTLLALSSPQEINKQIVNKGISIFLDISSLLHLIEFYPCGLYS